jgi:hypothetical protein
MKIYSLTNLMIFFCLMSVSTFLYNSSQSFNFLTSRDVRIAFFCGRKEYIFLNSFYF